MSDEEMVWWWRTLHTLGTRDAHGNPTGKPLLRWAETMRPPEDEQEAKEYTAGNVKMMERLRHNLS